MPGSQEWSGEGGGWYQILACGRVLKTEGALLILGLLRLLVLVLGFRAQATDHALGLVFAWPADLSPRGVGVRSLALALA